jgi:hypothetical protein
VGLYPRAVAADEITGAIVDEFGGLVNVAGWNLDVAVLDRRSGVLCSRQPAAQLAIDDTRIAQGRKRLMSGRSLSLRSTRQPCELYSGLRYQDTRAVQK